MTNYIRAHAIAQSVAKLKAMMEAYSSLALCLWICLCLRFRIRRRRCLSVPLVEEVHGGVGVGAVRVIMATMSYHMAQTQTVAKMAVPYPNSIAMASVKAVLGHVVNTVAMPQHRPDGSQNMAIPNTVAISKPLSNSDARTQTTSQVDSWRGLSRTLPLLFLGECIARMTGGGGHGHCRGEHHTLEQTEAKLVLRVRQSA